VEDYPKDLGAFEARFSSEEACRKSGWLSASGAAPRLAAARRPPTLPGWLASADPPWPPSKAFGEPRLGQPVGRVGLLFVFIFCGMSHDWVAAKWHWDPVLSRLVRIPAVLADLANPPMSNDRRQSGPGEKDAGLSLTEDT
jgi:hypothetical protein